MSIHYNKHYYPIIEALGVMTRYYHNEDFDTLKESLQKKSTYTSEIEHIVSTMKQIYEEIIQKVSFPKELAFYFESFDEYGAGNDLANAMIVDALTLDSISLDTLADTIKSNFYSNSATFTNCILEKDNFVELDSKHFFKELEALEINETLKWNIWRVYSDFDTHVDALVSVLIPIIQQIETIYPNYEHHFDTFHTYWSTASEDGTFSEKLKQATKVEIQDDSDITIYPNWMMCNSLRLMPETKDLSKFRLYLGLLFKEGCFVSETSMSRDEILKRLKLLSDGSKYDMMVFLKNQRHYGSQIASHLNLSTATISHHVSGLTNCGLLDIEKDSNRVYYRLNKTQIEYLIEQLKKDFLE